MHKRAYVYICTRQKKTHPHSTYAIKLTSMTWDLILFVVSKGQLNCLNRTNIHEGLTKTSKDFKGWLC